MPSVEEQRRAVTAWTVVLDDATKAVGEHIPCCDKPEMWCPGVAMVAVLQAMPRWEIQTLLEFALIRLHKLDQASKNLISNAETLAEEVLFANALPAHWCKECRVSHA